MVLWICQPLQIYKTYVDVNGTGAVTADDFAALSLANLKEIARGMDASAVSRKLAELKDTRPDAKTEL